MPLVPIDRSWRAVFRPWEVGEDAFAGLPSPVALSAGRGFDPGTAAALAELSRLAYQPDDGKRRRALVRAGLRERASVAVAATRALVVEAPHAVIVAFRGTMEPENWRTNLDGMPTAWGERGRVHAGFRAALERLWPAIVPHLDGAPAVVHTGHSLGGALATLAAARRAPTVTYTFGAPRVGTRSFVRALGDAAVHRVTHGADVVPALPPSAAGYRHAGAHWYLDPDGTLVERPPRLRVYAARATTAFDVRDLRAEAPPALADHAPHAYAIRLAALLER